MAEFFITGDAEADGLLAREPLALVLGMMLDQQVPMEWAFASPARLAQRLGGRLDAAEIAAMDPAELEAAFKERPALHRFPASMAKRAQELCRALVDHYEGRAERVWADVATGAELLARVRSLPGFGDEKARIFVALLAKRQGVRPPGWEEASAPFSDDLRRSVADADSTAALEEVRAFKKARKAVGKGKAD
ncbi:MAG: Fe-S cluster assembly protein HesB [Actinobacteria bacterium]|nr:Fe-S cluster assembly protein HesB [Actinomycetota bacterium]